MEGESALKRLADENTTVTEQVKTASAALRSKDAKKPDTVTKWSKNIGQLAGNLSGQREQGQSLSASLRQQEDEQSQCLRDKYSFLINKLKSDITFFANCLQEFIDPADAAPGAGNVAAGGRSSENPWDSYIHQVDQELKKIPSNVQQVMDVEVITNITPLQSLLNMRDELLEKILKGVLYQKAVLDWDIGTKREFSDQALAEVYDMVVNAYSKQTCGSHSIPNKLQIPLGSGAPPEEGPFTKKQAALSASGVPSTKRSQTSKIGLPDVAMDKFTATYYATLKVYGRMDKLVRKLHFGSGVCVVDSENGVTVNAQDLRQEITVWYKKCLSMDHELQILKAARHTQLSLQVEQLQKKIQSKEEQFWRVTREKAFLETDVTRLTNERQDLVQKLKEITERYNRMNTQTLPKLDKLSELVGNSTNSVNVLQADAELLSSMFRKQVSENEDRKAKSEHAEKEIKQKYEMYRREVRKNQFMQEELQKKESLIVRAMGARKEMQKAYHARGEELKNTESIVKGAESAKQEMAQRIEEQKDTIFKLQNDLGRSLQRVDELEQVAAFLIKKLSVLDPTTPFLLEHVALREPQAPSSLPPLTIERSGPIKLHVEGLRS